MSFINMVRGVLQGRRLGAAWLLGGVVLLAGCNTLNPNTKYAVYYYNAQAQIVQVEVLTPPHSRSARKPFGPLPGLADACAPSFPSKPVSCQGNFCPVTMTATSAVYYGPGLTDDDPVRAVGVEEGSFVGRSAEWPTGGGCEAACSKKCSAPSAGGVICIC